MAKKKTYHKKKQFHSSQGVSFSLSRLVLITVCSLILVLIGSYLSSKKVSNKELTADFGGVEKVINQDGNWQSNIKFAYFDNKILTPPASLLSYNDSKQNVLGTATDDNKWIDVSLSEQKLRAYEGNKLVLEMPISSGLAWTPTVTGEFRIWYKTRWTRMTGGSVAAGNYYDLPNVPFNLFFHNDYALHGAYWHNNFGHQMSHGCVNLPIPDAEKLFYWASPVIPSGQGAVRSSESNPGTRVVVHS